MNSKIIKRKNRNLILAIILAFTFSFTGFSSNTYAAKIYTKKSCYQTHLGQVCSSESYMKMRAKFTYKEAKKIVSNYNKWSDHTTLQYIIGLHPTAGMTIYFYNMGAKKCIPYFKKAVKKKKGVLFAYDYYLNNNSHALNQVKNMKISYVK